MKQLTWMMCVALVVVTLAGCGDKKDSSHSTTASAVTPTAGTPIAEAGARPTQAGDERNLVADTGTPAAAVTKFLDALRLGDERTAAAMLTTKARAETAAHDMVVEPPGAPNAKYTVERVEHPDDNPNAAYVSCIWSEQHDADHEESYEVVWVLRKEAAGWRVAGMATQLSDSDEPVYLDFEDLAAMEDAVRDAESAARPETSAQGPAASPNTLR